MCQVPGGVWGSSLGSLGSLEHAGRSMTRYIACTAGHQLLSTKYIVIRRPSSDYRDISRFGITPSQAFLPLLLAESSYFRPNSSVAFYVSKRPCEKTWRLAPFSTIDFVVFKCYTLHRSSTSFVLHEVRPVMILYQPNRCVTYRGGIR